jgi:hypothetical protein
MEVHHHPHVGKKNFKQYLLEGLMIFFAVTMGFIAENVREHITENKIANELAENLYQEVYNDSVQLTKCIASRELKEKELVYFINYIRDSSLANIDHRFYKSFTWSFLIISPTLFEPADGMISQLRNSGSLRYFKSSLLQKQMGDISVLISKIRSRNEVENSYGQSFIRPFILKFYNFRWSDEITQHGKIIPAEALASEPYPTEKPIIRNADSFSKTEAENIASYYQLIIRSTRVGQFKNYMDASHILLETLRKEYSLHEK